MARFYLIHQVTMKSTFVFWWCLGCSIALVTGDIFLPNDEEQPSTANYNIGMFICRIVISLYYQSNRRPGHSTYPVYVSCAGKSTPQYIGVIQIMYF